MNEVRSLDNESSNPLSTDTASVLCRICHILLLPMVCSVSRAFALVVQTCAHLEHVATRDCFLNISVYIWPVEFVPRSSLAFMCPSWICFSICVFMLYGMTTFCPFRVTPRTMFSSSMNVTYGFRQVTARCSSS